MIVGVVATTLGVGAGFLMAGLLTGSGDLVVTVAGPSNEVVEGVEIFIDGKIACTASPCSQEDLKPGPHFFRVEAPGFTASADRVIQVESGHTATFNLNLAPANSASAARTAQPTDSSSTTETAAGAVPPAAPTKYGVDDSSQPPAQRPHASTLPPAQAAPVVPRTEATATASDDPPPQAMGKLTLVSQPSASVVLDGRPLGSTPRLAVAVAAGTHTIMFSHPEHGRKVETVSVQPGALEVVRVQFP